MPEGKLNLQILDVNGKPITEPVDVFMSNLTLGDTPTLRHADFSSPKLLTGLNVFPNGRYRLEVDALSYHTVSRFVSIPPDGNAEAVITLPINPKKVIRVEFPAFGDSSIAADAWKLLEKSSNVLNFAKQAGRALYDALDDIRKAGFLNLVAKANRTLFHTNPANPRSVLSFIQEISELRGDRFLAFVPLELRSETINGLHDQLFHEVDEVLHTPPHGFEKDRSFKTFDDAGNLQLSFFSGSDSKFALDMDIDDAQGFEHVFQVVGNFFGGPTHPYNIHEILIASQELDPGYRLILD